MESLDYISFDTNSFDQSGAGNIIGGGGGSISTGDTSIPISTNTNAVGTINENKNVILNITSNVPAEIYINGENTYKTTTDKIEVSYDELIKNGSKKIEIKKQGFKTDEFLQISLIQNFNFNFDSINNINFGDSLVGYQTRLLPDYNLPISNTNLPVYSTVSP
ncbi:MAG: hypothetical protein ACO25K_07705, partial [Candidatus Fonsibacter ubiquis]